MKLETVPWSFRTTPLPAIGMLVFKSRRADLIDVLNSMSDSELKELHGCFCENCILIIAGENNLPWVPDALYLGQDLEAEQLYLPTQLQIELPAELLLQALQDQLGEGNYIYDATANHWYHFLHCVSITRSHLQEL